MSFSAKFFEKMGAEVAATAMTAGSVLGRGDFPMTMTRWLATQYQVMRAFIPLVDLALLVLEEKHDISPFCDTLHTYYYHKTVDEDGHAGMLLEDLEHVPGALALINEIPDPAIVDMVGGQYYLLEHVHPASLLGYIGLLEGFQASIAVVDAMAEKSKLPAAAFRTLRMHAIVDVEHRKECEEVLNEVPLALQRLVVLSGQRTARRHRQSLLSLIEVSEDSHA